MSKFLLKPLAFASIILFAVACATPRVLPQQPTVGDANPCLRLSLNVPSQSQETQETEFALELTNTCDDSLSFLLDKEPAYDIQISSPKNELVWSLRREIDVSDIVLTQELKAGQTRVFTVMWNQLDSDGAPVEAENYIAVGTLDVVFDDDSEQTLKTKPITLSINTTP